MAEPPFAFTVHRKPWDYRKPPLGRVIGSISLNFLKMSVYDPTESTVVVLIDVLLTEQLLTCGKSPVSKPQWGHGIVTGPSQQ